MLDGGARQLLEERLVEPKRFVDQVKKAERIAGRIRGDWLDGVIPWKRARDIFFREMKKGRFPKEVRERVWVDLFGGK